jgi:hypothetical protein
MIGDDQIDYLAGDGCAAGDGSAAEVILAAGSEADFPAAAFATFAPLWLTVEAAFW